MEELIRLYIDTRRAIVKIVEQMDQTTDDTGFQVLDQSMRSLDEAAGNIRQAAHRLAFFVSGPVATLYRRTFVYDRWWEVGAELDKAERR